MLSWGAAVAADNDGVCHEEGASSWLCVVIYVHGFHGLWRILIDIDTHTTVMLLSMFSYLTFSIQLLAPEKAASSRWIKLAPTFQCFWLWSVSSPGPLLIIINEPKQMVKQSVVSQHCLIACIPWWGLAAAQLFNLYLRFVGLAHSFCWVTIYLPPNAEMPVLESVLRHLDIIMRN